MIGGLAAAAVAAAVTTILAAGYRQARARAHTVEELDDLIGNLHTRRRGPRRGGPARPRGLR